MKNMPKLIPHILTAAYHAICFVGEPPFHIIDMALEIIVETSIASPLCGMDSCHKGNTVGMLQNLCCGSHKPVVGMYHVEVFFAHKLHRRLNQVIVHVKDAV